MVGKIIRQERIKQKVKSKDLAAAAGVDTGHLSHIEKGIRNPSKAILAKICNELNLSYQFMLNVAQNAVEENSESYDVTTYVPYNKVLYTEDFKLMDCPKEIKDVSLITKMKDNSMTPLFEKNATLYVHYTSVLNPKDVCLVTYNSETLVRSFDIENDKIVLSAANKNFDKIIINQDDPNLIIIGKIIV